MTKRAGIKNSIVLMGFALIIICAFIMLSNRTTERDESNLKKSAVQEVLSQDLTRNYPATPKEVVKLYSEITRCFYAEDYTEEELRELAAMSRALFDDELKATQTEEQYLMNLGTVIANYKEQKRTISSFSVSSASNVEYDTMDGRKWAKLMAIYTVKTDHLVETSKEDYLLRKDAEGRWKIYGWRVQEESDEG